MGQSLSHIHEQHKAVLEPPPAYEMIAPRRNENTSAPSECLSAPRDTDDYDALISSKCIRGSPTGGRFYYDDERPISLGIDFSPDPFRDYFGQKWYGGMLVKCKDISCLMREGFHWDISNIVREESYIQNTPEYDWAGESGSLKTKNYFLRDKNTPSRWVAILNIRAVSIDVLQRFRPSLLSRANILQTLGSDQSGNHVYYYSAGNPHHRLYDCNFNTIYDDRALQGWWPWPREDARADEHGTSQSDTDSCDELIFSLYLNDQTLESCQRQSERVQRCEKTRRRHFSI
ncbi:hypothetical protein GGR57DRAFT_504604 [Xylariaceae sp. FL1272]|nr:hypothetical protein GGR57DRAFT_504604 [Xylariaceae sp. FL1272]